MATEFFAKYRVLGFGAATRMTVGAAVGLAVGEAIAADANAGCYRSA